MENPLFAFLFYVQILCPILCPNSSLLSLSDCIQSHSFKYHLHADDAQRYHFQLQPTLNLRKSNGHLKLHMPKQNSQDPPQTFLFGPHLSKQRHYIHPVKNTGLILGFYFCSNHTPNSAGSAFKIYPELDQFTSFYNHHANPSYALISSLGRKGLLQVTLILFLPPKSIILHSGPREIILKLKEDHTILLKLLKRYPITLWVLE